MDKLQIFDYKFNDEKLENEFNNFFYKYNLTALFTNEHRASPITVTYVDARSVINKGGKYHNLLKDFADLLNVANDNKKFEEAIFKFLYKSRSFQGLMRNIRNVMDYISTIDSDRFFNMWNIVWYNKEVY